MKPQTKIAYALTALLSASTANAAIEMQINVLNNPAFGAVDQPGAFAAGNTGDFQDFAFNGVLATSVYTEATNQPTSTPLPANTVPTPGSTFVDTNVGSSLSGFGVPTGGLTLPTLSQESLGNLTPLTPPDNSNLRNTQGYNNTWGLVEQYTLPAVVGPAGVPVYTPGGTLDIYLHNYATPDTTLGTLVLSLSLISSDIQLANLNLNFDLTYANPGFLFVNNGAGYVDASTLTTVADPAHPLTFSLNTNVNPPIPGPGDLTQVAIPNGSGGYTDYGIRQSQLNGQITPTIPEPASLALIAIGLAGFSATRRKSA